MVPAEIVQQLTKLGPRAVEAAFNAAGYQDMVLETAVFKGITASGKFCYTITWLDEADSPAVLATGQAYVSYNAETNVISADV
jgi:hypothetical protein